MALKDTRDWLVQELTGQLSTRYAHIAPTIAIRLAYAAPCAHMRPGRTRTPCMQGAAQAALSERSTLKSHVLRRTLLSLALRGLFFPLLVFRDTIHEIGRLLHRAIEEERQLRLALRRQVKQMASTTLAGATHAGEYGHVCPRDKHQRAYGKTRYALTWHTHTCRKGAESLPAREAPARTIACMV